MAQGNLATMRTRSGPGIGVRMSAFGGGKADILAPADLTNGPYLVPVILSYGNMAPVGYGYAPHGEHLHRC